MGLGFFGEGVDDELPTFRTLLFFGDSEDVDATRMVSSMSTTSGSSLTRARFERRGVSVTHLSASSSSAFVALDGPGADS